MIRGIVSTIYAWIKPGYSEELIRGLYEERYKDEPFIMLLEPGLHPGTKAVAGSNHCHISVDFDPATSTAVIVSAIDNLGKGAASQAVQCMNIMFGLDETAGISGYPPFP